MASLVINLSVHMFVPLKVHPSIPSIQGLCSMQLPQNLFLDDNSCLD